MTETAALPLRLQATHGRIKLALCAAGEIWGGVEQFVYSLARHLAGRGLSPIVVVLYDGPLLARLEKAGISVKRVGGSSRYDPTDVLRIRRVVREGRVNVLHTHGYKATILGALAARLSGIAHVRTEHGRVEPWAGTDRLKMSANAAMERAAARWLTDAVVFVSKDIQRRSQLSPAVRQQLIYNGLELTADQSVDTFEGLPSEPGAFKIGIVGRMAPVKGHLHLLHALERLRHLNIRLYVFGTGPLEDECRRLCESATLTDVVRFMGFKPNIHDYLRQLDALVMPSLHEGLPYTLLEAMYHGLPVIASGVGGLAEVIQDGVNGLLVPPAAPAELAQAIERIYGDLRLREQLSSNARETICSRFTIDKMADQYLDVYASVL